MVSVHQPHNYMTDASKMLLPMIETSLAHATQIEQYKKQNRHKGQMEIPCKEIRTDPSNTRPNSEQERGKRWLVVQSISSTNQNNLPTHQCQEQSSGRSKRFRCTDQNKSLQWRSISFVSEVSFPSS